ncbi:copper chaperone PCu(A)C [Rhodovulum sp. ES.010]|uniref:copper chaperone PCu(A)C n=1 Tax=Rhodovulum sp. ES.010 TaxID=1882821 RepID=UPI0009418CD4|nr:copper chaperone PCu(A)C [Rhodovulum sp. ES.010]
MSLKPMILAGALALASALPALAGDIVIEDPYARASTMMSKSGAAFMTLVNTGAEDDRLVAASSDIAAKVELHTHREDAGGVMRMVEVEEGFAVPAGGRHELARGGDHVMFLGLTRPLEQGDTVTVTLRFETAGEIVVEMPVDLGRGAMGGGMQMGN